MGDVLDFASPPLAGRARSAPWYNDPDLVGDTLYDSPDGFPFSAKDGDEYYDETGDQGYSGAPLLTGLAVARMLPQDVFVPQEYVTAALTMAVGLGKTVSLQWMQMDFDSVQGCEVPIQHSIDGAHVMWVDDCGWTFGVSRPTDLSMSRVQMDCVTNIRVELITELPRAHPNVEANIARKLHQAGERHDREICPTCLTQQAGNRVRNAVAAHEAGSPHDRLSCPVCSVPAEQLPAGLQTDG